MNHITKTFLIKTALSWAVFLAFLGYELLTQPPATALVTFLLLWSFYILTVPAAHGQFLFGGLASKLTRRLIYTECFLWLLAVLGNIIMYFAHPQSYLATLTTHLLYRIISTPRPYWGIIALSAIGTWYHFITGQHHLSPKPARRAVAPSVAGGQEAVVADQGRRRAKHLVARSLLLILGVSYLLYLTHREVILLLNART